MTDHRSTSRTGRILRRCAAAVLALTLLLGGCAVQSPATLLINREGDAIQADDTGGGPHIAAIAEGSELIASSNYLSLYLDDASKTVIVQGFPDTAFTTSWATLGLDSRYPLASADACAAEITVVAGGERISLNTQDHSVAYGRAETQRIENGVRVRYFMYPDAKTAAKAEPEETDVAFAVSISYTLRSGNFYVEADWTNHSGNPDAFIESIGLMERFGTLRQPGQDDFLFLPDGSGALLYPARLDSKAGAEETNALRFSVYGEDPAIPQADVPADTTTANADGAALAANLAAFGASQGTTAFLALIEQGASLATITARPSIPGEIAQSSVGARFLITPTTLREDSGEGQKVYRAAKSYGDDAVDNEKAAIRLCYRFFFGDNANYSTMAVACREELIGSNLISSTKTVDHPEKALPLNLTILGTTPNAGSGTQVLSRFDEALDVLNRLWRANIASINVRYMGALTGGLRQAEAEVLSPLGKLEGETGLEELQRFCTTNTLELLMDADLLDLGGKSKRWQALALGGGGLRITSNENYARALGLKDESTALRSLARVDSAVNAALKRLGGLNVSGISVGDFGGLLYSDYSGAGKTREDAAQLLVQYMPPLSAQWRVMLDTGYFHIIRTADVVMNLPLDTQVKMKTAGRYEAVPFLQILLHGSMDYSGEPLNLADDPEETFLRSVEYGAALSYTWYCAKTDTESDDQLLFTNEQMDEASAYYVRANRALGDLRGVRILRHSRLQGLEGDTKGVTEIEYSNGAVVYVNYNDTAVTTVTGLIIPKRGFARTG